MTTLDSEFFEDRVERPSLAGVGFFSKAMAMLRERRMARKRIRSVANLSDHMLRDIGLDPETVRTSYPSDASILGLKAGFRGGQ